MDMSVKGVAYQAHCHQSQSQMAPNTLIISRFAKRLIRYFDDEPPYFDRLVLIFYG